MKKLTSIKSIFAAFVILAAFGLYSCQQETGTNPVESANIDQNYDSPDMYLPQDYSPDEEVNDCTLEDDMRFKNEGERMQHRRQHGFFLGRVLKALELDEKQRELVKGYLVDYHGCLKDWHMQNREIHKKIMEWVNGQKREILMKLKNGEITREEARRMLHEVNKLARERFKEAVDLDARCECLKELFRNIESVLDDEQLEIWKKFLENFRHPCFGVRE